MNVDDGVLTVLDAEGHLGGVVTFPFVEVLVLVGDGDVVIEYTSDHGDVAEGGWPRHGEDKEGVF